MGNFFTIYNPKIVNWAETNITSVQCNIQMLKQYWIIGTSKA